MTLLLKCTGKREQGQGVYAEFGAVKDEADIPVSKAIAGKGARCSLQVLLTPEASKMIDVGGTIEIVLPQK